MEYTLIRMKRKSLTVSVSKDLEVIVKAPMRMSIREIESFLNKNQSWILNKIELNSKREILTDEDIVNLKNYAKDYIPKRVLYWSEIMQLTPKDIKITSAKTRWGSCSFYNNLNFSYRLMLLELECVDYVIVHELAHILEKNHSSKFYDIIEIYLPNYKELVKKIKHSTYKLPM